MREIVKHAPHVAQPEHVAAALAKFFLALAVHLALEAVHAVEIRAALVAIVIRRDLAPAIRAGRAGRGLDCLCRRDVVFIPQRLYRGERRAAVYLLVSCDNVAALFRAVIVPDAVLVVDGN